MGSLRSENSLCISKELLAVLFCLQAFCKQIYNAQPPAVGRQYYSCLLYPWMDGTHSSSCNKRAGQIWDWTASQNIWPSVTHVPGVRNVDADRESRHFHTDTEWQLKPNVFKHVTDHFEFLVDIDMMMSRTYCQVLQFSPGGGTLTLWPLIPLALLGIHVRSGVSPPFSSCLSLRVFSKIRSDQAIGLMVVPFWPTQLDIPYWCST